MKETVAGDSARARVPIPIEVARSFSDLQRHLSARSTIVWAEHCSECDHPACYANCAYYSPRPDLKCRRFAGGFESLIDHPTAVRLHRIRFRKWGKLEGRGPVGLRPLVAAQRTETLDALASTALAKLPVPYLVTQGLARRWNQRKTGAAAKIGLAADAFVVETWSADGSIHPFTVSILELGAIGRMFQTSFSAGPAYCRLVIPVSSIASEVDLERAFLVQIEPTSDAEGREVVFGLCDFVAFKSGMLDSVGPDVQRRQAVPSPKAKVVIWDLDETLWTGTLAEDGPAGVVLRREVLSTITALDERGVLQSIVSKNEPEEALAVLRGLGLADYFLYPQIGWGPKSDSIRRIAEALDLGVDTFVLVDDQAFERAEVMAAHPTLRALPHTAVSTLLTEPYLALPVTEESRQRRLLYRTEATRATAFAESGTNYIAFLRNCKITLEIAPPKIADLERIYELTQRTNQLNFTGGKPSRDAVRALMEDPERMCLTLRCTDRFGDYGLIGFAVISIGTGELSEFFMSCRVQRKRVEHAFFAHAARSLRHTGHECMRVRFLPTERNGKSRETLLGLGFAENSCGAWSRSAAEPFPDADVVRIVTANQGLLEQ